MGKVYLSLASADLSDKDEDYLQKVFKGKTITLEVADEDLTVNDGFAKPAEWKDKALIKALVENVPAVKKFKDDVTVKQMTATGLGVHDLTVETGKHEHKGKIDFAAPAKSDPTKRVGYKPDKGGEEGLKKGAHPAKVKITGGVGNPPAKIKEDLKHLLGEMNKPKNYEYVGKTAMGKGWEPNFSQHKVHMDPSSKAWKAYIDQPSMGAGTTWRLYFDMDYDEDTKALTVTLDGCQEDH
ncbi:MAG: hypothetical protein HRU76_07920 [Phycisphaeraceae bacterium]|nr:hypothetical protein [Phycisphaerales bacterium]QOJ17508.1 MAG: hypothetical protein HRU76_07920 [Phycisphaeraceae bacterium]